MKVYNRFIMLVFFGGSLNLSAQNISLFEQFNGRYDYTAIGNTLNQEENNGSEFCEILSSSSDQLLLLNSQSIVRAYLYWAGSGQADTQVTLNGNTIAADLEYTVIFPSPIFGDLPYFSCFSDVTSLIQSIGNDNYLFSDLDISDALNTNPGYCSNRTNFAGWSLYVIYEDPALPLNQLSLFQGLEIINTVQTSLYINLDNINVLDNEGAKIGFLAWEGDANLSINETLTLNNNILSNPPLNPSTNAFNGTNSFANVSNFYSGDLDVYEIENYINIGDTTAQIALTTGADLIIINNVVTVLNSQLPDVSVEILSYDVDCESMEANVAYVIHNNNATDPIPANTPTAIYLSGQLIGQSETTAEIPIDGQELHGFTFNFSQIDDSSFLIDIQADDMGNGIGTLNEINEDNNGATLLIEAIAMNAEMPLDSLSSCGENSAIVFDLTAQLDHVGVNFDGWNPVFFETLDDAAAQTNPITLPEFYYPDELPRLVYLRVSKGICYQLFRFELISVDCPIEIPQGLSPNGDGLNDLLLIEAPHDLKIYNRHGKLVYVGNQNKPWDGTANRGTYSPGKLLPVGTYFYVVVLHDAAGQILRGWVYLNY